MNKYQKYFLKLFKNMKYKDVNVDRMLNTANSVFPEANENTLENALNISGIKVFYDQKHKFYANKLARIAKNIYDDVLKKQPDYGSGTIQEELDELYEQRIAKQTGLFYDESQKVKEDIKTLQKKRMNNLLTKLKNIVGRDLTKKKIKVQSIDMSLGNFRGHPYIGFAKIIVNTKQNPDKILKYLQNTYSSKFKLKKHEDNMLEFNIR